MNISNIAEKTTFLKIEDNEIKVSSLPEDIRFEVDTLDRYNQKKLDIIQELEIIELAIKMKESHIKQLITSRKSNG